MGDEKIGCGWAIMICLVLMLLLLIFISSTTEKWAKDEICEVMGYDGIKRINSEYHCIRETETGIETIRYGILLEQLNQTTP